MLLTENIAQRVHEWMDRNDEPDLVPRFRRMWREAPAAPRRDSSVVRAAQPLERRPVLQGRAGA